MNGVKIITNYNWGTTVSSSPITLNAGTTYPVELGYVNTASTGYYTVSWSGPATTLATIPATGNFKFLNIQISENLSTKRTCINI